MGVSSRWFSISLRPLRSLRRKPLKRDRQREFRFDVTICDIKTSFSGAEKNALPRQFARLRVIFAQGRLEAQRVN